MDIEGQTPGSRIIEITPEMERRIMAERRQGSRDRIADLERRLSRIADILESGMPVDHLLSGWLAEIYKLARGT